MHPLIELATALCSSSLTLFIGTGFSKFLTDGKAPSWVELLALAADELDPSLRSKLFKCDSSGNVLDSNYPLLVVAEMLAVEFDTKQRQLKETVAEIIRRTTDASLINTAKLDLLTDFFADNPSVNIVTTNYDTLITDHIIPHAKLHVEGRPIPRVTGSPSVFHIHGCARFPETLVLTMSDYHEFIRGDNYFSRKFFTILQESTVAILGYSLGDFNLNNIFYEVKVTKPRSFRRNDGVYIARRSVDDVSKKYYFNTFGIKVIENQEIDHFFTGLRTQKVEAKRILDSVANLSQVLSGTHSYRDEYLKLQASFHEILIHAGTLPLNQSDPALLNLLIKILQKKQTFTQESGAWDQYAHLADWIVELASSIEIVGLPIESDFKGLVLYSLEHASKKWYTGKSWNAYTVWAQRWKGMLPRNRALVTDLIAQNFATDDIYSISLLPQNGA